MSVNQPEAAASEVIDVGSFGTPREIVKVKATFTWFGETIRVHPDASELDLLEFMGAVGTIDERDVRAIPAMRGLLKAYVHPGDWDEFWQTTRRNRAQMPDFMALAYGVTRLATEDRPTGPPDDSSDGPQQTAATSGDVSSSVGAALAAVAKRADLAGFITDAQGIT